MTTKLVTIGGMHVLLALMKGTAATLLIVSVPPVFAGMQTIVVGQNKQPPKRRRRR